MGGQQFGGYGIDQGKYVDPPIRRIAMSKRPTERLAEKGIDQWILGYQLQRMERTAREQLSQAAIRRLLRK